MTHFFVRHPVTTWMIFGAFVLLGAYAIPRLDVEAVPEVDLPTLTIQTYWNGASPQAVQRSITLPVEEAARKVHGVEEIRSTSRAARSDVRVSFRKDVDIEFARVDLNEQLGSVRRNLPLNAGQPQILPYYPEEFQTEQFFSFSLESPLDPNELRELAEDWVVLRIIALEGVADARVLGGARPLIKIFLDRRKLDLYGITPDEIFAAIDRLDELQGAGTIYQSGTEKFVALRDPIRFSRLEKAVVATRGERFFTLGMLGDVQRDFEDPVYFVRTNGNNVVQIFVDKRSGANSVAVSRSLRAALPRIQEEVPFDVSFHIDEDQGEELESKLRELVYRSLVILALLFLLLVVSLRQLRLTVIVTGSIIFAVVISLSFFYFLRISVNFITISGLTVCFGLILDNSILVLDAIHRRLGAMDKAEKAALSRAAKFKIAFETIIGGTREVLFPILTTTATTIVAFVSFIFLSGRLALFYVPLGISVTTALVASLFVAFGWVPMVMHGAWAIPKIRRSDDGPNDITDPREITTFTEDLPDLEARPPFVERIFHWNQRLWWIFIPITFGLFIWGGLIYDTKIIKGGFWRLPDIEQLLLYMEMPSGTDIRLTSETLQHFEDALLPVKDGVRMRSQTFGNQALLRIEFEDEVRRSEIPMYYRHLLMEQADKLGGTSVFISGFSETPYVKGSFGGSTLNSMIKITGYNSRRLRDISEGALRQIQRNRRVRNARITTGSQFERMFQDEIVVTIDREALAAHGLSVIEVVAHTRRLLGVDTPWTMLIDDEHKRVQLGFEDSESIEFGDAAATLITTPSGERVQLGELVRAETRPLSGSIIRENQRYTSYLNWEYVGTDKMRVAFIKNVLASLDLPYGYAAEESQREFFTQEEEEELTLTLVLAVAFIFMVMAALFESVTLPFLVLISVPMALFGVFVAFWVTDSSFDSSARIGLILLFGIVVNNAILLASRFRTESTLILKKRLGGDPEGRFALFPSTRVQPGGVDLFQLERAERPGLLRRAVARAVRIRLRSILLTSGTTIVGLLPLLIHFRETQDKDIWENLALASIGGLVSSTLLILFAIPAFYYVTVRFVGWPWRDLWARAPYFGRCVMATGVAYLLVLLASIGVAAYQGHVLYGVTDQGAEVSLAENHRHILRMSAFVIAGGLAVWTAALGTWRPWWQGLIGLVGGTLVTGLLLSVLTFLDLPFVGHPVGVEWLKTAAIPLVVTWVIAIGVMRLVRFPFASRRVGDALR
jgi:HAE1 family hydrophobic/amphiphilic exporter-1